MSGIKEKKLNNYPEIVSLETTERIINQMKKNIVNIYLNDGSKGTGFFCKIKIHIKMILWRFYLQITNNQILSENDIKDNKTINITMNNDSISKNIKIDENRIKYTNKEYDITFIELK